MSIIAFTGELSSLMETTALATLGTAQQQQKLQLSVAPSCLCKFPLWSNVCPRVKRGE